MASAIIVGANGRMGWLLEQALLETGEFDEVRGYDVDTIAELDAEAPAADLVVDFSRPTAVPHVAAYVRRTWRRTSAALAPRWSAARPA